MKNLFSALLLGLVTYSAAAQTAPAFTSVCNDRSSNGGGTNKTFCETRDLTLPGTGGQTLTIDGKTNGGISVQGYDGTDVRVRAKVTAWASTDAEAGQLAKSVVVSTTGNALRATGPGPNDQSWAVSYEVFVPRQTALALSTLNGGISLRDLDSSVSFAAVNGGVSLTSVAGKVKGQTVNGGLHIKLTGAKWEGEGLDVQTTNGGITWDLPKAYSAKFFTSTNAGSISAAGLPVTKSGFTHREVTADLGQGGAPIKAVTINGGIKVSQD